MSLKDKQEIDAMGLKNGDLYLLAYERGEFDNEDDILSALQEKLEIYFYFILDGQYKKSYGDVKNFYIVVDFKSDVTRNIENFFTVANVKMDKEIRNLKKDINVFASYQISKKEE